jgi:hypothetical protein
MGAIYSLPRCLFFSFELKLDAVHNCPYSNGNLIRYAPDPSYPFIPFFSSILIQLPPAFEDIFQRV